MAPIELSKALKSPRHSFRVAEIVELFKLVDEQRVDALAAQLTKYIRKNLPAAFEGRDGLADYRTNPYVLMTSANVMKLTDMDKFGAFLFNSKLYMALETSFGKSVESAFTGAYPLTSNSKWEESPEKRKEFDGYAGLNREEKAQQRTASVWREIDRSCVVGDRRYLVSIKSGPNTINDSQVQAMTDAIINNHKTWLKDTKANYGDVKGLDIVIGLTYGTDRITNNKENQILVKLLQKGFEEEDREKRPGVLIDTATRSIRVYRRIGKEFWAFIGDPSDPAQSQFVFLEILLGLGKALAKGLREKDEKEAKDIESRINAKIDQLVVALAKLKFPRDTLPAWIKEDFNDDELFWFATAMTAFYDDGI